MKIIDNINSLLRNDLKESIIQGTKLKTASEIIEHIKNLKFTQIDGLVVQITPEKINKVRVRGGADSKLLKFVL